MLIADPHLEPSEIFRKLNTHTMFSGVSSMPCRELPEHDRDNMYLRLGTLPSWCFVLVRTYSYVVADGRPVTFHTVHYEKINILHRFKRKYIMLYKYVIHNV